MHRRRFLKDVSAVTAAVLAGLTGCSKEDSADPESPAPVAAPPPRRHPDLLASYWTIAGDANPGTGGPEWSPFDFRDRVEAIAKAGFKGIGLWHSDVDHTLESYSLADMKKILDDNGIVHLELEFIQMGSWLTGDGIEEGTAQKNKIIGWAEALQARHVKIGDFFNTPTTLEQATEVFAMICQDAANAGTGVVFEMMPFAMINDFDQSIQMVKDAGASNGGVIVDTWHMMKMDVPMSKIAALSTDQLRGIELNDGWKQTPEGLSLAEETVLERQFPGEGDWDMPAFMSACQATDYDGPYGVEVINANNRSRSLDELVARAYQTTASMFA